MSFRGDYEVKISKLELENDYLLKHEVSALRTIKILKRIFINRHLCHIHTVFITQFINFWDNMQGFSYRKVCNKFNK